MPQGTALPLARPHRGWGHVTSIKPGGVWGDPGSTAPGGGHQDPQGATQTPTAEAAQALWRGGQSGSTPSAHSKARTPPVSPAAGLGRIWGAAMPQGARHPLPRRLRLSFPRVSANLAERPQCWGWSQHKRRREEIHPPNTTTKAGEGYAPTLPPSTSTLPKTLGGPQTRLGATRRREDWGRPLPSPQLHALGTRWGSLQHPKTPAAPRSIAGGGRGEPPPEHGEVLAREGGGAPIPPPPPPANLLQFPGNPGGIRATPGRPRAPRKGPGVHRGRGGRGGAADGPDRPYPRPRGG